MPDALRMKSAFDSTSGSISPRSIAAAFSALNVWTYLLKVSTSSALLTE